MGYEVERICTIHLEEETVYDASLQMARKTQSGS